MSDDGVLWFGIGLIALAAVLCFGLISAGLMMLEAIRLWP